MPALRPVPNSTLVAVFEQDGFVFDRQRGDHLIYTKAGVIRPLVIPAYHEVPVFIIKNPLRTAAMSRERYFELLDNLRSSLTLVSPTRSKGKTPA
jgi:predicted RNA binding protein YcfA (HicA-like mRNA interferase family)